MEAIRQVSEVFGVESDIEVETAFNDLEGVVCPVCNGEGGKFIPCYNCQGGNQLSQRAD
jgi:DnaJ-class molecular chaperone